MALPTPAPSMLAAQTGEAPGAPTFVERLSFVGDDSYPTGGTAAFQQFVRDILGGRAIEIIDIIPGDCADNVPYYDKTNDKLKVRVLSTGAEVANATNLSGVTFNLTVLGK